MAAAKADAKAEPTATGGGGGGGGGGSFTEERLSEKLNKLSSSAASIQTLSNWCIFHRKRARRVVDTWQRQFNNATTDKKVSFLYLSNDILQNSKRKGGEFVNEFWRVLPGLLKDFYENGGQDGKKVVARLIGIWDERKVFGTRSESLKDILGDNPPALNSNSTTSNPTSKPSSVSKSSQRDSSPIIKKLTVSGMPEKIITAYQSVLDQYFDEDTALNKCKITVGVLEKMNKDVDEACTNDIQQVSSLISNLQEQEAILKQCIEQLESVDAARITLISNLKEALSEEEKKSELLRNQLQVARAEAEHAVQLRQRFGGAHAINGAWSSSSTLMTTIPSEQTAAMMQNAAISPITPQFQPPHPAIPLSATASAADDEPKKTAAAMADKLASLASPEQVLSSILASLAAEQAASMNGGPPSVELSEGPPGFQIPKRPRIENPTQTGDMGAPPFFGQLLQAQQNGAAPTSLGGMQSSMQANQALGAFAPLPPPLPPMLPPLLQQFSQNGGGMFGMGPFGMLASSMPPPLPNMLPPGFPRPSGPPPPPPLSPAQNQSQTQQQQQSPQAPQQSPTSTGFFPTPGIGFFPPVQMQQSPSVQRQ
ncbi:splicing factor 1-like [Triticum dicoccoides]|uniref:splicing factor 1-like n=1 Tax=Triticum dicoccoides TaxID=85692 RepID=UPI000E7CBCB0|nr:splicing factor 1-like [Triticum dicoccoides]XP_037433686.1 splicing factor 1-like [Triticum dicoccoides]